MCVQVDGAAVVRVQSRLSWCQWAENSINRSAAVLSCSITSSGHVWQAETAGCCWGLFGPVWASYGQLSTAEPLAPGWQQGLCQELLPHPHILCWRWHLEPPLQQSSSSSSSELPCCRLDHSTWASCCVLLGLPVQLAGSGCSRGRTWMMALPSTLEPLNSHSGVPGYPLMLLRRYPTKESVSRVTGTLMGTWPRLSVPTTCKDDTRT